MGVTNQRDQPTSGILQKKSRAANTIQLGSMTNCSLVNISVWLNKEDKASALTFFICKVEVENEIKSREKQGPTKTCKNLHDVLSGDKTGSCGLGKQND